MSTVDLEKRASARRALLAKTNPNDALSQRAEARKAVLQKLAPQNSLEDRAKARRAYMQSGPGPNDPKNVGYPGEMKYPRMEVPVGGDSRQWEQNWFEGAAARDKVKFGPAGVELELKKKLQRASDAVRSLDKTSKENPAKAKALAAKIANDLNGIVVELDKAGYVEDAQEADSVLEQIAAYLAQPTASSTKASIKEELVKLANVLDGKGYTEEANAIDKILSSEL